MRAAVRQGGFGRATGFEINPSLVWFSRMRSMLNPTERFHVRDLWKADVSDARRRSTPPLVFEETI